MKRVESVWSPSTPVFRYFEEKNAIIASGNGSGLLPIHLTTFGIGNGLTVYLLIESPGMQRLGLIARYAIAMIRTL
jgi:hypothetical protein